LVDQFVAVIMPLFKSALMDASFAAEFSVSVVVAIMGFKTSKCADVLSLSELSLPRY